MECIKRSLQHLSLVINHACLGLLSCETCAKHSILYLRSLLPALRNLWLLLVIIIIIIIRKGRAQKGIFGTRTD